MPTNLELLESLRQQYEELPLLDHGALDKAKDRGRMITSHTFGEDSRYFNELSDVDFQYRGPMIMTIGHTKTEAEKQSDKERSERYWLRGQEKSLSIIDSMLEQLGLRGLEQSEVESTSPVVKSGNVFVVHGHDDGMRESVARVLTKLGLQPVILHEQEDQGRTVIEKFYDYSDVEFAVVLLSPDDTGYSNAKGPEYAKPRARQNVIFELGFFLGKLGRKSVVALHKGEVEIPSDYAGVIFQHYEVGGVWPYKLAKELRGRGYSASSDSL